MTFYTAMEARVGWIIAYERYYGAGMDEDTARTGKDRRVRRLRFRVGPISGTDLHSAPRWYSRPCSHEYILRSTRILVLCTVIYKMEQYGILVKIGSRDHGEVPSIPRRSWIARDSSCCGSARLLGRWRLCVDGIQSVQDPFDHGRFLAMMVDPVHSAPVL